VAVTDEVDPLDSGRAIGDAGAGEERVDPPATLVDGGIDGLALRQVHPDRLDPGHLDLGEVHHHDVGAGVLREHGGGGAHSGGPTATTTRLPSYRNLSNRLKRLSPSGWPRITG
jgi:hypothetical protein